MGLIRTRSGTILGPLLTGVLVWHVSVAQTGAQTRALEVPPWLPRYDLDIHLLVEQEHAHVVERVTWTNRHERPASELVFNAHSHYQLPDQEVGKVAKMLELLRLAPWEGIDFEGHACEVLKVSLCHSERSEESPVPRGSRPFAALRVTTPLPFHYQTDNQTALVVPLPRPVRKGESVTIEIEFSMRLPQRQGRWGQWRDVTFLSNWLPVLAYYDDKGWQPTPFIPWHQPFFNEAGVYTARVTLPADQKIACTGTIHSCRDVGQGEKEVEISVSAARDFALLCSPRFQEFTGQAGPVQVRCLAFPEHEYYAREMVRAACEAIPVYEKWFGPYPYPEFTLVESYFGWNGNECSGLVMIDERIFGMPHAAGEFVEYLVSHETCHQWWYNVVGTNGYAETWMDEGLATYFSHRLMDIKHGKNSNLLKFPKGLEWLPNIQRESYRTYGLYGTIGRGEAGPTVQDMPKFGHLANLLSMCYDRGSRIVGIIEDRLGESAFFDFMRIVYKRYQYRILRVADFQRELESYTGQSWEDFFQNWLYGAGMTDWCIEDVRCETVKGETARRRNGDTATEKDSRRPTSPPTPPRSGEGSSPPPLGEGLGERCAPRGSCFSWRRHRHSSPCRVTVILHQKAEITEQTVLGFRLDDSDGFQVRIPILPQGGHLEMEDPPARVEWLGDNRVCVVAELPCRPTQIAVDPDQVLVDRNPCNNYWKPQIRWRFTPLYTQLDETDLTTAYDRWNVIAGPWIYGPAYDDPWFTRSSMVGFRAGLYRLQDFNGGAYLAYRSADRDVVAGVDGLWNHWPWPHTQVGFDFERGLTSMGGDQHSDRGVLFGRYVFQYTSSLYLPPMHYAEMFGAIQDDTLPLPRQTVPGADHFDQSTVIGVHYHLDYLTPYWDPEAGYRFDATYATGIPIFGEHEGLNRVEGQLSAVNGLPDGMGWLSQTRLAARIFGAAGLPDKGEFFSMGGAELFRGFDLAQRQGSLVWVGSLEWRVPVATGLNCDLLDHSAGLRNIYAAAFYDVGDAYLRGHPLGDVAHAVGGGLRFDVAWFGFIERTILRVDIAKTLNASTPLQVWVGVQHPF